MKKVSGQSGRVYYLDEKSKKNLVDGESYKAESCSNIYIKLLKDCSKAKQQEVEGVLRGQPSYTITDDVTDLAYNRGSFVGYIYQMKQSTDDFVFWGMDSAGYDDSKQIIQNTPPVKKQPQKSGTFESFPVRIGIYVALAILIGVLNIYVIYKNYLDIIINKFGTTIFDWCKLLGVQGATSLVIGLGISIFLLMQYCKNSKNVMTIPFVLIGAGSMLLGIFVVDFLITLLILLIFGAINLIKALIPIAIAVAVAWAILKYAYQTFFRS